MFRLFSRFACRLRTFRGKDDPEKAAPECAKGPPCGFSFPEIPEPTLDPPTGLDTNLRGIDRSSLIDLSFILLPSRTAEAKCTSARCGKSLGIRKRVTSLVSNVSMNLRPLVDHFLRGPYRTVPLIELGRFE
jgi:hypothetical protein